MNHNIQYFSNGKTKGHPIYVETEKAPFDYEREKERFIGLMYKGKEDSL